MAKGPRHRDLLLHPIEHEIQPIPITHFASQSFLPVECPLIITAHSLVEFTMQLVTNGPSIEGSSILILKKTHHVVGSKSEELCKVLVLVLRDHWKCNKPLP